MVSLLVGGWFASAAIAKLKDLVSSYVDEQLKYQKGLKSKLQKLQESLTQIEAIVAAAEQNQVQNPSLNAWVLNLKDAVCDAEDVLDLFNYRILENQVKGSCTSKVCLHVPTYGRRLLFRDADINKLIGVIERFDQLVRETSSFLQLVKLNVSDRPTEELEWRQTTPISVEAKVYGRGNDMEKLLKLIEGSKIDSETNSQSYAIISIAGIGGVGKTTLSQSLYNLPQINSQFNLQAWVCISNKFSIREITIKIIESAGFKKRTDLYQLIGLEPIQEVLMSVLKDKRFLIVLDDVWNEVNSGFKSKWETLAAPFRFGSKGSRVVVTTRDRNVARQMESNRIINLEVLEDEDFQELFAQCAFGDNNPKDFPVLEAISKKISQKLGGLPLAAKTVGSVLRNKIEEKHWFSVLDNRLWEVDRQADRVLDSLELSYSHLPATLKQCFVFCALFPKNHLFKRDDLVHFWVALGYVNTEVDGKRYFDELESRFFFQKYKDEKFYVVHDLLHDVAEYACQDEICRVETSDGYIKNPKAVRHLYVSDNFDEFVKQISDIKKLRSLVIDRYMLEDSDRKFERLLLRFFRELKGLRILMYYGFNYQMEESLPFDLRVHLRYFRLENLSKVSQFVHKLYHLQVLDIGRNESGIGMNEPFSLDRLINLRYAKGAHIGNWSKYRIGRQTSLQQLEKPFAVERKEGHRISELRNLRQLTGYLHIENLYNVWSMEEARETELHRKEHLDTLTLDWSSRDLRAEAMALHEQVIGGLQPHRNLKKLKLFCYAGRVCPFWLEERYLPRLKVIELEQCHQLQEFSPIGQLPYLEILKLKELDSLELVGLEIYGEGNASAFPLLETLELSYMKNLTEWTAIEDGRQSFPLLRKLIVDNCPKLRAIPVSSVKEFEFFSKYDAISSLTNCLLGNSLAGLQSLYCGLGFGIRAFTAEQEEWLQKLTSLKEITFAGHSLTSLPSSLKSIPSLDRMYILGCQYLQLSEDGLPNSLKELHVKGNGEFITRNWHKIAYIPTITHEGKPIYHPIFSQFAA